MSNVNTFLANLGDRKGTARELEILKAVVVDGNYPPFMNSQNFIPLEVRDSGTVITLFVAADYVSVGDASNFMRTPMYPTTAQAIANHLGCLLPTKRLVDKIYAAGTIVVEPVTYAPKKGEAPRDATSVYVLTDVKVDAAVKKLCPNGYDVTKQLVVGHKKDIVLTNQLLSHKQNVAIYGWHQKSKNGAVIQGLNAVDHSNGYVDYSHGVRLISKQCLVDGVPMDLEAVYKHSKYGPMLTGSLPLGFTRYPVLTLE